MTQYGYPISDISAGTWTTEPLYSKLNDQSDATEVTSTRNATNQAFRVALTSTLGDPESSSSHSFTARMYSNKTNATGQIDLYEDTTLIASYSIPGNLAGTVTPYSYTLSGAEADAITDYTLLRIEVTASVGGGGYVYCTDIEFQCPDAFTGLILTPGNVEARLEVTIGSVYAPQEFSPATVDVGSDVAIGSVIEAEYISPAEASLSMEVVLGDIYPPSALEITPDPVDIGSDVAIGNVVEAEYISPEGVDLSVENALESVYAPQEFSPGAVDTGTEVLIGSVYSPQEFAPDAVDLGMDVALESVQSPVELSPGAIDLAVGVTVESIYAPFEYATTAVDIAWEVAGGWVTPAPSGRTFGPAVQSG